MQFTLDLFAFTKKVTKSCDEVEQVNSGWKVNQFEMKHTSIEFVINVSRQGNIVKIKLNSKRNLQRLQS